MRISKTLVAICAIALSAAVIGNAAPDDEAQAKAREALRRKLAEEGQSTTTTPAPAPAAPVAPVAPVAPAPAGRFAAPVAGQEDRLREALRQKIQELNQQEASGVTPAPAVVAPAPVVTPAPVTRVRETQPSPSVSTVGRSAQNEEQLRQALRQKIQELNQQEGAVVAPAPGKTTTPVVVTPAPVAPASPMPAASPLDPAKEEQLRQALRQKIEELNQSAVAGTVPTLPADQSPQVATESPRVSDEQIELMRQRLREKIAEEQAQAQAARVAAPAEITQPAVTEPATEQSAAERRRLAAEAKARADAERAAARAAVEEQRRAEAAAKAEAQRQAATRKKPSTEPTPQVGASGFAPIIAPPSALSSSKEARLADLTRRYKADQITPEEYHTERAKLIAEP